MAIVSEKDEKPKDSAEVLVTKPPEQLFGNPTNDSRSRQSIQEILFYPVIVELQGTVPQTATNYGNIFTADRPYRIISVSEVHRTAGSDAGAVTLQVEKLLSGTAKGAGLTVLSSALSLKTTADTPQFGTLTSTKTTLILRKNDRLGLLTSGTLTALADVQVTIMLQPI